MRKTLLLVTVGLILSSWSWSTVPLVAAAFSRHHTSSTNLPANKNITSTDRTSNRITDDSPLGCKELRSKRYISDGFCTSVRPITEVVCAGHCLPVNELPWYSHYMKMWSSRKSADEWRCIDDVVTQKQIHLLCENGERRSYRIRVVRSCKCKKYKRSHNKTSRRRDRTNDQHHQFYDY